MAHNKHASRRGNFKSRPRGRGGSRQTQFVPFVRSTVKGASSEYTLKDEALSTFKNRKPWDSGTRLRNAKVTFISGGTLEKDLAKEATTSSEDMSPDSSDELKTTEITESQIIEDDASSQSREQNSEKAESSKDFVIDLKGSESIPTGLPSPRLRSVSPTPSNSSEEVILFQGRNFPRTIKDVVSQIDVKPNESNKTIFVDIADKKKESIEEDCCESIRNSKQNISPKPDDVKFDDLQKVHADSSTNFDLVNLKINTDDELMADYLANIDPVDEKASFLFSRRDIGGSLEFHQQEDNSVVHKTGNSSLASRKILQSSCEQNNSNTLSKSMRQHENKISGDDTRPDAECPNKTLSKMKKKSSTSLSSHLTDPGIQDLDEEDLDKSEHEISGSDYSNSSEEVEDEDLSINYYIQNRMHSGSDLSLNIMLAGYDDIDTSSDDGNSAIDKEKIFFPEKSTGPLSSSKKKKKEKKRKKKKKGITKEDENVSAVDQFCNEYDVFDIMGFDRPSTKKGKKKAINTTPKFSDPTMEKYMNIALQSNRLRKSQKKKERENLRSLGLLNSKNGKADLRVKYKDGMAFHQLKEEIRLFLMGDSSTLILPPMDKSDRKIVHEIAHCFKLKSKSDELGSTRRHPILYRTSRTTPFDEEIFDSVGYQFMNFFPGKSSKGKNKFQTNFARKSGSKKAAVSYQDGDIVGGSAPELAADNKGRTMLEKMGWSAGTALGASNNKGILQPVSHIVKKTKAGLG